MEISNSDANHAVLHARYDRGGLGPTKICNCGHKVAVLHLKTIDKSWVTVRLVILVIKLLFCMQKPQMRAGTHRD